MRKKILLILLMFLLLTIASSVFADYPTIVHDYPELSACKNTVTGQYIKCVPGQSDFGVPEFIRYIFIFALGSVGVIGVLAIMIAAFDFVMAVGNPQKASTAKDKIVSALLGLLLLLGSYVILNLVNPDLLKLKLEAPAVTVDVPIETPPTPTTKCILKSISWDKGLIKANESARLTFNLSDKCAGLPAIQWTNKLRLLQEGGAEEWLANGRCDGAPDQPAGLTSYYWICTFPQDRMINKYKNAAEKFYLEGILKLNGVDQKIIEKRYITVQDLKNDGTCCK